MSNTTGIGISNPLFFMGVVENNFDERLEGRVQVRAFGIHGTLTDIPTEDLPWAILCIGNHDVNFTVPPINAWVFGCFIDGRDAQQPIILGLIPTQMTTPINPAVTGWGVTVGPERNLAAQGSRPQDAGQPTNSRLMRAENLEETNLLPQETNRKRNIPIAGGGAANLSSASFRRTITRARCMLLRFRQLLLLPHRQRRLQTYQNLCRPVPSTSRPA